VQGPDMAIDPSSPGGDSEHCSARTTTSVAASRGLTDDGAYVVYEEFRSKAVRSQREKDGPKSGHQAEWNQRFVLHVPGDIDDVRLVLALFDRPGGAALGREQLLSYTIVPLLDIARHTANHDHANDGSDHGEGQQQGDENDDSGSQRPVLEFTLHPAGALKRRRGLNDFLKRTAKGRDDDEVVEPKLKLSLAVHKDIRKRSGWQYARGTAWKPTRASAHTAAVSSSGKQPLLQGQNGFQLNELHSSGRMVIDSSSEHVDSPSEQEAKPAAPTRMPAKSKPSVRFRGETELVGLDKDSSLRDVAVDVACTHV